MTICCLFLYSNKAKKSELKVVNIDMNEVSNFDNVNNQYIINNNQFANLLRIKKSELPCEIINKTHKHYSVVINGLRYPQYLFLNQNYSINFDCINQRSSIKTILAWNRWYGEPNFGYGGGKKIPFINRNCPVINCELTDDRSRVNETDMVMVLMSDRIEEQIPSYRPLNQRWIFVLIESPYYTGEYSSYNNVFNLTADYLIESDFASNYESQKRFLWNENKTFDENRDFHNNRSGFMAALISNCNAQNARLDYIEELQKYIEIKIYGRCGQLCSFNLDCRQMIGTQFKFFFAFENSVCRDYITEKFFLILKFDTIPVVLGGGNYSRFVS